MWHSIHGLVVGNPLSLALFTGKCIFWLIIGFEEKVVDSNLFFLTIFNAISKACWPSWETSSWTASCVFWQPLAKARPYIFVI
jgi:hypothetical protein